MNGYLRQSTASQVKTVGAFVDDTDFKTLENALSIANTDIKIKKNGAASVNKNSGGATADGAGGMYSVTWDATDTATVGELFFSIKVAGALVVFGTYVVEEEAEFDARHAAAAPGYVVDQPVNTTKVGGTTQTPRDLGANLDVAVSTRVAATIFTGITSLAQWLGLLAGKQIGNATARTEIRATGAGAGTFDEVTDSQEGIRDRGDAAWVAGGDTPGTTTLLSRIASVLTITSGKVDVNDKTGFSLTAAYRSRKDGSTSRGRDDFDSGL